MHCPPYLEGRLYPGQRQSLTPLANILQKLGNPQLAVPTVLVGGTNGKGSTVAFLTAILEAAGLQPGVFTSPSLEDFLELIRLRGAPIQEPLARSLAEEVLEAAGDSGVTLFELATGVAFLAFARTPVPLAILEVGLGGRQDATNLSDPCLSVLTSVALDHCQELGDTLQAIALEKLGISRAGRPLLCGASGEGLQAVMAGLSEPAPRLGVLGRDFGLREALGAPGGVGGLRFEGQRGTLSGLRLSLEGEFQRQNAALAVAAAYELQALGQIPGGLEALPHAIREGLSRAWLPGRLEKLRGINGLEVWVDGAHNPHGAQALARSLAGMPDWLAGASRGSCLIFAAYADKDLEGGLAALLPAVGRVICTSTGAPRCASPEDLLARARKVAARLGWSGELGLASGVGEALEATRGAGSILVAGSLSVVGATRRALGLPGVVDAWRERAGVMVRSQP